MHGPCVRGDAPPHMHTQLKAMAFCLVVFKKIHFSGRKASGREGFFRRYGRK